MPEPRRAIAPRLCWARPAHGVVGALLLLVSSAGGAAPRPAASAMADETIGVATRNRDGTIVLRLRADSGSGMTGEALVRYAPDDPRYAAVSRHVGVIPKGGSVFVKPFGDR